MARGSFKLIKQSFENMKSDGVPKNIIEGLMTFEGRKYNDKDLFLQDLLQVLGKEQVDQYATLITKNARRKMRLLEQSFVNLLANQIPLEVVAKLKVLENRKFSDDDTFVREVTEIIGAEFGARYRNQILKQAMRRLGKVLVVEDNPQWSNRLKIYFEEDGFHVTIENTIEEALAMLEGDNKFFHCATIDLQLDEGTLDRERFEGWTVLKKMCAIGAHTRMDIVVLSGFEADENRKKALKDFGVRLFENKSDFDKDRFLLQIIRHVDPRNIRFKKDFRD